MLPSEVRGPEVREATASARSNVAARGIVTVVLRALRTAMCFLWVEIDPFSIPGVANDAISMATPKKLMATV
jgi:hypothetical protein